MFLSDSSKLRYYNFSVVIINERETVNTQNRYIALTVFLFIFSAQNLRLLYSLWQLINYYHPSAWCKILY